MQRTNKSLLLGLAILIPSVLVVLAGCSGGGGALTQPETGPDTSATAAFIQLLPAVQRSATTIGSDACGNCHRDPYHNGWKNTRHAQVNTGCESCHGPGSAHAAAPAKTNILTGGAVTSPEVCGQCHGPTHDQFKNSRHASPVQAVLDSATSNPKTYVATCFRCHSASFRAKMVDDKLAVGKTPDQIDADIAALTADQLSQFIPTTHESATCGSCHDPHRNTANLTSTGNQAYLRRATSSLSTTDVGPGQPVKTYTTFNHICASCHNGRGIDGSDTRLRQAASTTRPVHENPQYIMLVGIGGSEGNGPVVRNSSHSTAPDQCVHCHMPNRRHTFTVSLDTSCAPCHTAADAAAREESVRSEMLNGLLQLRTRMERWAVKQFGADKSNWWDYTSLISEEGDTPPTAAQEATVPIEIRRARHNYYFVLRDSSFGVHNTPYARHLMTQAQLQLDALGISRAATIKQPLTRQDISILTRDALRAKAADGHDL